MSAEREIETRLYAVGISPANGWNIDSVFSNDNGAIAVKHAERGLAFFVACESKSHVWRLADNLVDQVKDLILLQFAKGAVK